MIHTFDRERKAELGLIFYPFPPYAGNKRGATAPRLTVPFSAGLPAQRNIMNEKSNGVKSRMQ